MLFCSPKKMVMHSIQTQEKTVTDNYLLHEEHVKKSLHIFVPQNTVNAKLANFLSDSIMPEMIKAVVIPYPLSIL